MMQETRAARAATDDYVEFWAAGATVKGEFHCSECGYGVAIVRTLLDGVDPGHNMNPGKIIPRT